MTFLRKHWTIILIILIAAFVRFYRLYDYAEFLGDQGRDVVIVREFLKHGNLFFIGPQTSIGNMYLGPFYYYLFVAPGLILSWFNPVGPAIVIAFLGVLTVYLVYQYSKEWFDERTAIMAALIFALSPVVIKYSTFSWNPNVMPLFALLFIHYLLKSRYLLATIAFIICLNAHFLALLLLPVGFLIVLFKKPFPFRQLLLPVLILILSFVPQLLFDIKHQGQNINAFATFFIKRETTINLKPYKAIPQMVPLFNQVTTRLVAGKNESAGYFVSTLFASILVFTLYQAIKKRKFNSHFLILTSWLTIGLVGLALYKQHIYDHYFGFLYPVVIILFAYLINRLPKYLSTIVVIIVVALSLIQNPLRWEPPRQLFTTQEITRQIVSSSEGQPFNFALLAKMNYDPGYRYFFSESHAPVKLLQEEITSQLFVACEPFQMDCNPINNPEWSIAAFGWAKIDKEWDVNGIKIFRLVHNTTGVK
ncbi:MAG: hypothetical protein WC851_01170 [Candidatus Shapirobacteria bacterium]|jgi:4-amino-4-deoxy-L-arabinose transferase-like glycosyltransferase